MQKHRTRFLILALGALIGLAASESRAGTLTMTITANGHTIVITPTSPFAQAGSTNTNLQVNTTLLNSTLGTDGSAITFSNLGATSNLPGAAQPVGATLGEGGTALSSGGTLAARTISIVTTQTGFSVPSGLNGTLNGLETSSFTGSTMGDTQATSSSYQTLSTATHTYTSTGPLLNGDIFPSSYPGGIGTVPTSYSLDASAALVLTSGTDKFAVSTQVSAGSVPEPASIVMMLTGMPLPLAIVGLIFRRRRAAAG